MVIGDRYTNAILQSLATCKITPECRIPFQESWSYCRLTGFAEIRELIQIVPSSVDFNKYLMKPKYCTVNQGYIDSRGDFDSFNFVLQNANYETNTSDMVQGHSEFGGEVFKVLREASFNKF